MSGRPTFQCCASVKAPDRMTAGHVTALMVMPIERAKVLVESIPELAAYWIIANGSGVEEQTSLAGRCISHILVYLFY